MKKPQKLAAHDKIVGYCRVSTEDQATEGVSLAAQKEKLTSYSKLYELDLIEIYVDAGLSAKTLERPQLQEALEDLRKGRAIGLLVIKLDRLTRSVRDLGLLIEEFFNDGKRALLSVSEQIDTRTASGRLMLNVLSSVSQWEREVIAERTKDALAHLKANGVRLGSTGLGWVRTEDVDGEGRRVVEEVPAELRLVEKIVRLRKAGSSLRDIADALEQEGWPTKRGGKWQAQTIAAVLAKAEVQ